MKHTSQKILVSGVKPTGRPHIGNYFGAMREFVNLQNDYHTFIFIADLHALTSVHNAAELQQSILDMAIDYLAIGLDPRKVTLFKQSDVPAHPELGWIFNCITTMPYLMRAHAFKDAEAKNKEINVGVFTYPMLMASDILLYDPNLVPVGHDQKQHLEIARDTAEKFNRLFGDTFTLPEPLISTTVGIVPGTDGQKMSKSYGNTIGLFATYEEIVKAVMSIPTDSKGIQDQKIPEECKVFALHRLFATPEELDTIHRRYRVGGEQGIGYKESKELLIASIERFIAPLREKRMVIARNPRRVKKILAAGAKRARTISEAKMNTVRARLGLTLS